MSDLAWLVVPILVFLITYGRWHFRYLRPSQRAPGFGFIAVWALLLEVMAPSIIAWFLWLVAFI